MTSSPSPTVWDEVQAERERAHAKHGDTSMESLSAFDLTRLSVLMEEVGEVAREFNEFRHTGEIRAADLRKELIQVAAMAGSWADTLGRCAYCGQDFDTPPCLTMHRTGKKFHEVWGGGDWTAQNASSDSSPALQKPPYREREETP